MSPSIPPVPGLIARRVAATLRAMSTLVEIEKAIETLPEPQVNELAGWLDRFRQRRATPSVGEHHDLDALIGSWREDPQFDAAIRAFAQVDEAVWK